MRNPLLLLCFLAALALAAPASAGSPSQPHRTGVDRERPALQVKLEPLRAGGKVLRTRLATNVLPIPAEAGLGRSLVITEKIGHVLVVDLETGARHTALDIAPLGSYPEMGLVGFAFAPDFAASRKVVTYHLDKEGGDAVARITEWVLRGQSLAELEMVDRREVFQLPQPQEGHNGGALAFGPDGYLYIAFGDGGFQRDPNNLVQAPDNYFGSMLRIDPSAGNESRAYGIPADNPFVDGGHLPEVWAWGFRNPWRWTFTPSGQLLLADVGQNAIEELNLVVRGGNYGWSLKEGSDCFAPRRERSGSCDDPTLIDPLHEYARGEGAAIIGGFVYTGEKVPAMSGKYLFGDHMSSRLWAMDLPAEAGKAPTIHSIGATGLVLTTFGLDPDGEILVAAHSGRLFRVVPRD